MADKRRVGSAFEALERLSFREKGLVAALAFAVLATLVVLFWFLTSNQIQAHEERNEAIRSALEQIGTQKDAWVAQKARLDSDTAQLDNNKIKLVREMESEASRIGFTIEDFKENKRYLTDNRRRLRKSKERQTVTELAEESQTVTIRRINVKQLAEFLFNLEKRREPVKVTRLNIRTASSDRQLLREVRLTVSTYRNEEVSL